jgi:hypothetical protein
MSDSHLNPADYIRIEAAALHHLADRFDGPGRPAFDRALDLCAALD